MTIIYKMEHIQLPYVSLDNIEDLDILSMIEQYKDKLFDARIHFNITQLV